MDALHSPKKAAVYARVAKGRILLLRAGGDQEEFLDFVDLGPYRRSSAREWGPEKARNDCSSGRWSLPRLDQLSEAG